MKVKKLKTIKRKEVPTFGSKITNKNGSRYHSFKISEDRRCRDMDNPEKSTVGHLSPSGMLKDGSRIWSF